MSITKNQSDFNAVNTALNDIKERLLEKGNRHRDTSIKEIDAHARGYLLGVFDALEMVEAAEQQEQNAPRTNLDRIRAMSVEKLAIWLNSRNIDCDECPAAKICGTFCGYNCVKVFETWLNSPAKEDNENA